MVRAMLRVLMAIMLAACGTSALSAGAVCHQPTDCESDLMCLDIGQFSGSACTVVGKTCSKTCSADTDCAALGSSFHCFAGCGSDKFCGATSL
jgi:hypothetical protein